MINSDTTITFTDGELAAVRRFVDTWLGILPRSPQPYGSSEWRAIHKIRHPNYAPGELIPERDLSAADHGLPKEQP